MARKIIGIDLGSYSVKVAELERGLKSFTLVGFYERPVQYSELLSPDESLAIALQGLIDDHNLDWDNAIVGFYANKLASRVITFPFGGTKKVTQAVPFELETFIPFDLDEVVWDFSILKQSKEFSKVLVAYAQKKDVQLLLSMLDGIGINPRKICAEGIELSHLMNLGLVPPEGGYAIVDIGHTKSVITVCHGTELGHSRSILVAGKAITEAIAAKLSVPYEEAERLKIELGQILVGGEDELDETTQQVSSAIKEVIDDLVLHLRQTLFSYRETEDVPPQGIYLSGGTSRLPGLDRYLSDVLRLNVTYLDCTEMQFSKLERSGAHRHVIPNALSLALRGVAGGGVTVDFRKDEFSFTGDVEQMGGGFKKIAVVVGLLIFLALISFSWRYYGLKKRLNAVNREAGEIVKQILPDIPKRMMKSPKQILAYIKSKESEMNEKSVALENLLGVSPLNILREISKDLPSRDKLIIDVEALSIAPPRIVMRGRTDSFESVDRIKKSLEKIKYFENVSTGNVRKGIKDEVKFDLSLDVKNEDEENQ